MPGNESAIEKAFTKPSRDLIAFAEKEGTAEGVVHARRELRKQIGKGEPILGLPYQPVQAFCKDGKLSCGMIAREINRRFTIKTTHGDTPERCDMFLYDGGVYGKIKFSFISNEIKKCLEDQVKPVIYTEVLFHVMNSTRFEFKEMNRDKDIINLANGLFSLKTGKLSPHTPDHLSTIQLGLSFEAGMDCPMIRKFLREVLPEKKDRMSMEEFAGFCLQPDYFIKRAFMLVGDGDNGKTTWLDVLKTFLRRENIVSIPIQEFSRDLFSKQELYGKVANIMDDLPANPLKDSGPFKMITGRSPISAAVKFKERINFENTAKAIYACNIIPPSSDTSSAYYGRWVIFPFTQVFRGKEQDPFLIDKLTTDGELSGLFNLAVAGLKRLREQKDFTRKQTLEEIIDLYELLSSPAERFIREETEEAAADYLTKDELYASYVMFCKERKIPARTKQAFSIELARTHPEIRAGRTTIESGKQETVWFGVKFKRSRERVSRQGTLGPV